MCDKSRRVNISEFIILSIPFLAIPLPNSKDNHQLENAILYEDKGYFGILIKMN